MLKKNSGIFFILIFSIVIIISINSKNFILKNNCRQISSGGKLTDEALNSLLTDTSKQNLRLKDLLSDREYTWAYFFSPHCPACKIVSANIMSKADKNLIGFALTASPFPSIYQSNNSTGISIFCVEPAQAASIGICSVPILIKIGRHGEILEAISSYKPMLRKIKKL